MTPSRPPLRPLDPTSEDILSDWLDAYIGQPHGDMGRDGPICPYVPTAVSHNLVVCLGRHWIPGETDARGAVTDHILDTIAEFQTRAWPIEHPELRAVIAAIPDLPREQWPLLDDVQQSVKGRVVTGGLMLGQFHLDSHVPAARNASFFPSAAPLPLVVVRQMARHDLWFLHQRADWFRAYQKRFAHTFEDRTDARRLSELYRATAERYGRPARATTAAGGAA